MFKDSQWLKANDKEKIYKRWKTFIKGLCTIRPIIDTDADYGSFNKLQFKRFTKSIYEHMHLHCGFIAHYSRNGFFSEYFNEYDTLLRFFDRLRDYEFDSEYGDLNTKLIEEYDKNKSTIKWNYINVK